MKSAVEGGIMGIDAAACWKERKKTCCRADARNPANTTKTR
uniref:Uncharacterized protein n=1 Tax=uncultured bacterium contig00005 TaxID=1181497 RepID=A0A806JZE6_9BACT|nr:hypothetical protein [uncultured bacterium contig00005]